MTLTPFLTTVNVAFLVSVVVSLAAPSPYVFSTLSNTCFIAAAAFLAFSRRGGEHLGATLPNALTSTGALLFLGCSSLAYHSESIGDSNQHFADILGGWLLVVHVAITSVLALLTAVLYPRLSKSNQQRLLTATTALNIGLTTAFLVFALRYYDEIKRHQLVVFLVAGPLAAVASVLARFFLIYRDDAITQNGVVVALLEVVALLVVLFSGVICQGELLLRKLDRQGKEYDLFHGVWHFSLAISTGALYTRNGQVVSDAVDSTSQRCVCTLSASDAIVLVLLLSLGVTMTVVKEANGSAEPALVVFAFLLFLHALYEGARVCGVRDKLKLIPQDDIPLR